MFFGVSRIKDTGAYDLGELDQALFLYLDGQDVSTIQDQRRECSFSLNFFSLFTSKTRDFSVLLFSFSGASVKKILFGQPDRPVCSQ